MPPVARLLPLLAVSALTAAAQERPRLLVLTDIGGDPDDQQSMVRLMLYSNEFDIEGLIASASGTPGELKPQTTRPDLIREIVDAYAKVFGNLSRHSRTYPDPSALAAQIKSGNPRRGVTSLGAEHDTEASNWIIRTVDQDDPRPVNVSIWGGATDLAQALWRVRNDRSSAQVRKFVERLRVHSIGHQDDTGPWILENFPKLFFVLSSADRDYNYGTAKPGRPDKRLSTYRGMYLGGDESLTSLQWLDANVRANHGPLGALYPPKTWTEPNPHAAMKEGDTPSWFYFLPNGLSEPAHPEWGSWGGRFQRVRDNFFNDAPDKVAQTTDPRASVWRWRPAFQADFAARMDWCARTAQEANHPPDAMLNYDAGKAVVHVQAVAGDYVTLWSRGSRDLDRHKLTYRWWSYPEAGDHPEPLALTPIAPDIVRFRAPARPAEIHVIMEAIDNGVPPLISYRRAVVHVEPPFFPLDELPVLPKPPGQ